MKKMKLFAASAAFAVSMGAANVQAACTMLVDHFDVTPAWTTSMVIINLGNQQDINIKAITDEPNPIDGSTPPQGTDTPVTLTKGQKKGWVLKKDNPGEVPTILPTGLDTGYLFISSPNPIQGFVLFGQGSNSLAALGPIDAVCN